MLEKIYLMTWAYVGHFEGGFQEAALCSGLDVFMKQGQFYDCALNLIQEEGRLDETKAVIDKEAIAIPISCERDTFGHFCSLAMFMFCLC